MYSLEGLDFANVDREWGTFSSSFETLSVLTEKISEIIYVCFIPVTRKTPCTLRVPTPSGVGLQPRLPPHSLYHEVESATSQIIYINHVEIYPKVEPIEYGNFKYFIDVAPFQ